MMPISFLLTFSILCLLGIRRVSFLLTAYTQVPLSSLEFKKLLFIHKIHFQIEILVVKQQIQHRGMFFQLHLLKSNSIQPNSLQTKGIVTQSRSTLLCIYLRILTVSFKVTIIILAYHMHCFITSFGLHKNGIRKVLLLL